MAGVQGLTAVLGRPHSIENEFVISSQVAGKDESGPLELDLHHNKVLTRKLLWKLDTRFVLMKEKHAFFFPLKIDTFIFRILPVLSFLFLCSFLDRTNVGNAKVLGLEKDIGLSNGQYANGLAIFYLFYIVAELPSNLILSKASPRLLLAFLTAAWGIIGMCLGFIRNYADYLAVRAFLGLAEGGLLPGVFHSQLEELHAMHVHTKNSLGMILYLSAIYTRGELALRVGLFYVSASLAGAFGGLLARGFSAIPTTAVVDAGWRWILIIEGLLTFAAGVAAYFLLPNSVEAALFLTSEERELAKSRLNSEYSVNAANGEQVEVMEKFRWSEVRRGVCNVQLWLTATTYVAILSGLYSFGLFLPTIINGLGYTANQAQLWSVLPYSVASVVTVAVSFLSDRLKVRGIIMLCTLPLAIIGYAVTANLSSHENPVKYGMTVLMATGLYASVPPILTWNSNNSAGHYKRATTSSVQLMIANCGGFICCKCTRARSYQ